MIKIGIAVLLLAGCDDGAATDTAKEAEAADWQALPDGSRYSEIVRDTVSNAARCWSTKGDGDECIEVAVVRLPQMGPSITVERKSLASSGSKFIPGAGSAWSYRCSHNESIGLEEEISLAGNKLASRARSFEGRWRKSFVVGYLKDNNLRGRYFDCVGIMDALTGGSLATLRTTSISRAMLR